MNKKPIIKPPAGLSRDELFFFEHAGYGWRPDQETEAEGKANTARVMARAEAEARHQGWTFHWKVDQDADSKDFAPRVPRWDLWWCRARDASGRNRASLGAVDFGRDAEPWGQPYRRVVEAELALDGLDGQGQDPVKPAILTLAQHLATLDQAVEIAQNLLLHGTMSSQDRAARDQVVQTARVSLVVLRRVALLFDSARDYLDRKDEASRPMLEEMDHIIGTPRP